MNINRKFNSRVFKLWLHHKICVCRNLVLDSGIALAIQAVFLCLHTFCLCWLGFLRTWRHCMHFQSKDWVTYIHLDAQKESKKFVLVTSWVHPCLLSPLEIPSGTHSIPAPGCVRASFMLSQLPLTVTPISRIWPCNGNSWPNPASRCQPSCFLDFH